MSKNGLLGLHEKSKERFGFIPETIEKQQFH
jgi:hypothetical protein